LGRSPNAAQAAIRAGYSAKTKPPWSISVAADATVAITWGSSYANRANLAPAFLQQIIKKYEGTRLGRQELNAELLLVNLGGCAWARTRGSWSRRPRDRPLYEGTRWRG
jgi:phage terminase large subunit-like protein